MLNVADVGWAAAASRLAPKRKVVVASGGMSEVSSWISTGEVAMMLAEASAR